MGRYYHRERWASLTEEGRTAIRARVRAGEPYSAIARDLKFCRVMLRKTCPRPPVVVKHPQHHGRATWEALSDKTRTGIRGCVDAGESYTALAKQVGIHRITLARMCPRPPGTPSRSAWARLPVDTKTSIVQRALAGETYAALSREVNIAASTLQANVQKTLGRSKPKAEENARALTPQQIAEKIRRDALARRADDILRSAGLNPVSKIVATEVKNLRPLRPSFMTWRNRQPYIPQVREAILPTAPQSLPRGDRGPVMDGRWGDGKRRP